MFLKQLSLMEATRSKRYFLSSGLKFSSRLFDEQQMTEKQ